ncbi:vitelline envelope sperm lysin receptor-like [Haliotis cracherodii]|uniref:vitelline envelope sperm lysin receptor-like n=1 Tax=Haliotis cracherodii TaxID=6455 RepID=UPI0039ED8EA8
MTAVYLEIIFLAATARAAIPPGYIMEVTPDCGSTDVGDGVINIISDLSVQARAVCAGNKKVDFTTQDGVSHVLPFSYPTGGSHPCVFNKRQHTRIFSARVVVTYGQFGSQVHHGLEEYIVTCTFSPSGEDISKIRKITQSLLAANAIHSYVGGDTSSTIILKMVDVLGHNLNGRSVDLGRTVQLKAVNTGTEPGIRPVSCDAIDSSKARYSILRAGCGDGIVFPKTVGFRTTSKRTRSPYFQAFTINVDPILKFECNFTVCGTECDGDSCQSAPPPGRQKRGLASDSYSVAATGAVAIINTAPDKSWVGETRVDQS